MQYAITARQTTIDFTLNSKRFTLLTYKKCLIKTESTKHYT